MGLYLHSHMCLHVIQRRKLIDNVVYVGMGLDLHQILYWQVLRVKDSTAFRWVVMLPPIRLLSDTKDSKSM